MRAYKFRIYSDPKRRNTTAGSNGLEREKFGDPNFESGQHCATGQSGPRHKIGVMM